MPRQIVPSSRPRTGDEGPAPGIDEALTRFGVTRPDPVGPAVPSIAGPPGESGLPGGIGLPLRLAAAVLFLAAGLVGVPLGLWLFTPFGRVMGWPEVALTTVGLLVAVWYFRRPFGWVAAALAGPGTMGLALAWTGLWGDAASAVTGLVVAAIALLCAVAAVMSVSLPLARDIATSTLAVVIRVGDGWTWLVLTRDQIAVRYRRRGIRRAGGCALPLDQVRYVQAGRLSQPAEWPSPDGRRVDLGAGPAVRIVADDQQWLVGARRPEAVSTAIAARVHARRTPGPPAPSDGEWADIHTMVRGERPTQSQSQRGLAGRFVAMVAAVALTALSVVGQLEGRDYAWLGAVFFGVPAVFSVVRWRAVRKAFRLARLHPVPAGSGPWGESRPDHAPVRGWQPTATIHLNDQESRPAGGGMGT